MLLAFGGIIFWSIVIIVFASVIYSVETDGRSQLGWPLGWLIVFGIVTYFVWRDDTTHALNQINWSNILLYGLIYLVLGIVWMFYKWNNLSRKKYKQYLVQITEVETYNQNTTGSYKKELPGKVDYIPYAKNHKEEIITWIILFPFSIIRYIFQDLFTDLAEWFIKSISGLLNKISSSHFND